MHIPQDELQKFQSGTMDTEEMIHFLEHMEQCDFCLDQLLQEEETASAPAPSYLQGRNYEKSFFTGGNCFQKIRETAYWFRLLCAGLRTAVGMGVALIMLFSVSQSDFTTLRPSRKPGQKSLHLLTSGPD